MSHLNSCSSCHEYARFVCSGCQREFCQCHTDEHQQTLDRQLQSLVTDTDQMSQRLSEESVQSEYAECWADIDSWEQEEIEHIQRTANLMRQEVVDAVSDCLSKPRKELGLLLDQLDLVRQNLRAFDEIDLNQWGDLLERVKTLAKFQVTLSNVDNGLELLVTGKNLDDLTSFQDNERHPIGLVPIRFPELPHVNHTEASARANPTTQQYFDPIDIRRAQESRSSTASLGGAERSNQRPATQLRRPAAAEIPFERRTSYPLRWRVNV